MAYYNKLSDKIRNGESLPDGLAWEDMEAGIMDKMAEKKDKKGRLVWILFPILALIGVSVIFFISNTPAPEVQSLPKQRPTMIATKKSDIASNDIKSEPLKINANAVQDVDRQSTWPKVQQAENAEQHKIKVTSQNTRPKTTAYPPNSKNANDAQVKGNAVDRHERSNKSSKDVVAYSENIENSSTLAQKLASEIINKGSDGNVGNMSQPDDVANVPHATHISSETHFAAPNSIENAPSHNTTEEYVDFLPGVSMLALVAMKSNVPKLHLNVNTPSLIKPSTESYLGQTDLYIYGGYSLWQLSEVADQGVDVESIFNVSEKSLPSFNMGVRTDISLSKNIYASTGIGCMSLYSVYDYNAVKSIAVTQQNVVTQIRYDLISSNTSNVYGDTIVMASQTRQARARNNILNLSIPLVVGLQTSVGNWTLKGGLGTVFSVFTAAKGKTEYEGNYVTVDHSGLFKNTLGVALTGDLSAQYQWTNRFFIGAQISANHFANTFAISNKLINLPTIYGVSITSGMKF